MYKRDYDKFIASATYRIIEFDIIYQRIRELLIRNMTEGQYLDIEELIHAEILFKLESGFQYGYEYASKTDIEC